MAKGLFAVYRDETADPSPSTSSSRTALSTNRPTARRKDGSEARDGLRRGLKVQEKENVDPFARRTIGKDVLGKGKKPALGAKSLDGSCGKGVRQLGAKPSATLAKPLPSSNGICTGSLRTRVLPDLPPLAPAEDASSGRSSTPSLDPFGAPPVVDINLASTSAPSSPRTALGDRSFSTVDSGYARSPGRASDDDVEVEVGTVFRDESEADPSFEAEEEPVLNDGEANRRARNLTESPLAEITQAFTGLGGFSAANMSPTPSHVRRPASRPAPPTRTRSSLSKVPSISTLPLRTVPYSTTATTKRVKPGQAASTAPKTAPPRSLRF